MHDERADNGLNLCFLMFMSTGYKFDYHRIDLYNPGRLCSHFGFNATKGNLSCDP